MVWDAIKRGFGKSPAAPSAVTDTQPSRPLRWISADESPFRVRMLDVRSVTRHMTSASSDPLCAQNAISMTKESGEASLLLARGAHVDVRSGAHATPLMQAAQAGSLAHLRLFADRGADVNARDVRGFTALHRAAEMVETEIVKELLARGAQRDLEALGHTPLALARMRGEAAVVELLAS